VKVILLSAAALAVLALPIVAIEATPKPQPVLTASTTCDSHVARAYPDGRDGTAVYVAAPGPDVVTVDINGATYTKTDHRRLSQQVTKRGSGAYFDFAQLFGFKADSINVITRGWSCSITPPVVP
jgi:hypothetical protein